MFAKILNTTLIKCPYGFDNLREENPYTNFDTNIDLPTLYSRTEDATNTGATIVEIAFAPAPSCNYAIEKIIANTEPTLIDGVWTIGSSLVALTQEELDALANGDRMEEST
jgi:hypothetical protein